MEQERRQKLIEQLNKLKEFLEIGNAGNSNFIKRIIEIRRLRVERLENLLSRF